MQKQVEKLEKKIGIFFKDKKLLKKSLIHKSLDKQNNNEKLEFLGDRVLGLIISKHLLKVYPDDKEGTLDKKFANLVNKKKCYEIAKVIGLEHYIHVGKQVSNKSKIEPKILSDCCEALTGAIFADQGIDVAETFILKFWKNHINKSVSMIIDSKTKLQEYSLKKFKKLPIYKLIKHTGPKHKPSFMISVKLENSKLFQAKGSSKKEAEQKAAKKLLDHLL